MKVLIALLMVSSAACAEAAISRGYNGAEAKAVTIANIEEGDDYIIVMFSRPLEKGAECAAKHRDALLIEGSHSTLANEARHAYSLGQAIDVWATAVCTRLNDYETMSALQTAK